MVNFISRKISWKKLDRFEIFESISSSIILLSKLRLLCAFYSMLLELVIWNLRFIIIPGEMYLEQGNYSFLSRRIILAGSKGKLGHLFRGFLKVGNSSKTFPPFCPNFYLSPSSLFTRIVSKKFSSRDKSKWSINLFEKRDTFFFFFKKYRDLRVFFFYTFSRTNINRDPPSRRKGHIVPANVLREIYEARPGSFGIKFGKFYSLVENF